MVDAPHADSHMSPPLHSDRPFPSRVTLPSIVAEPCVGPTCSSLRSSPQMRSSLAGAGAADVADTPDELRLITGGSGGCKLFFFFPLGFLQHLVQRLQMQYVSGQQMHAPVKPSAANAALSQ